MRRAAECISLSITWCHPEQVQENTGFQLDLSRAKQSEPPADAVLEVLVNKVDPCGL